MLHALIRRDSIIATIAANLLTFDTVNRLYRPDAWGAPIWEWMPESFEDKEKILNATHTYLGRLVPLSRAILLCPDGKRLILANGLDYPTPPDFPPEPSAGQVKKRDGSGLVLVSAGSRALWRELPSLVVRRKLGEPGGPLTLTQINDEQPFDLWVGALETDQASIRDTVEGVYSIPAKMLQDDGRKAYEAEVAYADQVVRYALSGAAKKFRQCLEIKPQEYPEQATALRHYWNAVEQLVFMLNAYIAAEDGSDDQLGKRKAWRSALWKAAREAYQVACPFGTPRQRRAYALGLRSLTFIQRKADETTTPTAQAA